jgi:3-deoxy-manno-octulosonate cytidylyltransferase (CMP-KDO synthetase)
MSAVENPIILIPARMASTRLPNKPLVMIAGLPMIVQVWQRAMEADCGRVVVAAAEQEIADAVKAVGGEAILTDPDLPSGSDRIFQALMRVDADGKHDAIINLQGDLPTLDPQIVKTVVDILPGHDMSTLVAEITTPEERDNPNVVKAILSMAPQAKIGRALYFTRSTAPSGEGPLYHHIGIYAYQRAALEKFVSLPPSPLEQRERLEQLRGLEAGMSIAAACVDTVPVGVDAPDDLALADRLLSAKT